MRRHASSTLTSAVLLSAATAKHLIRTGAHSARVAVTLWNTGANDGYRRETFGDRITIERRITNSGASKYRVMDWQGRVVSEKRDDMQVSACCVCDNILR